MVAKTVVITGANRGIGLAFAQAYAKLGYAVFGTARDPAKATELADVATVLKLDVSSPESIAGLAAELKDKPGTVDVLINNAGVLTRSGLDAVTKDELVDLFVANCAGPLLVVQALRGLLAKDARVVNITSRMGSIDDNDSGGYYAYRASKSALNSVTKSLALDLKDTAKVLLLHPGYIKTSMTSGQGDMMPDETVARMMTIIEERLPKEDLAGKFLHRDGQELPW